MDGILCTRGPKWKCVNLCQTDMSVRLSDWYKWGGQSRCSANSPNLVVPDGPVSEGYGKDRSHFWAFQIHSFPTHVCSSRLGKNKGVYAVCEDDKKWWNLKNSYGKSKISIDIVWKPLQNITFQCKIWKIRYFLF